MEAVILVGIQAAGKSTFYRERFFQTHLRISLGLRWERYEQPGTNPQTGQAVTAQRRRLRVVEKLPVGEAYAAWLAELLKPQR
jgi:hypothetical protein